MDQFYDNVYLGLDGIVYARRTTYRELSHLDEVPDSYQPVNMIDDEPVPRIRQLLWVNLYQYIGVTMNGELFSFRNNSLVELESPIKDAYVTGTHSNELLVLLENGRLRLIHVKVDGSLASVNNDRIDRDISQDIVRLWAIDASIVPNANEETVTNYTSTFIAITYDNEFLYLVSMRSYRLPGDNYDNYLVVNVPYSDAFTDSSSKLTLINNMNLRHQDIHMIRGGYILMNNGDMYIIKHINNDNVYTIERYYTSVNNVIDMLPQVDRSPILLNNSGELYRDGNRIEIPVHPASFVYYYTYNREYMSIIYEIDVVAVRTIDGGIYDIASNRELLAVTSNLRIMGRYTKSSRSRW